MPLDATQTQAFSDFVLGTGFDDVPAATTERVQDLVLDLIGVWAASHPLPASGIARETAVRLYNSADASARARIGFDGRTASLAGAAYAGATQTDSLDAHDGYSPVKGHAGCALLPGVSAFAEHCPDLSGREFLAAMVVGYETACRAGLALHATVSDYHTSGAWVALAVAGLGVRLANGDAEALRQAVGIAEYHGPRSQMMREIDNPTMLHDGSGWGALVGVSAADLALSGFQGAPAITIEAADAAEHWRDLGAEWLTERQNIKLYPVCRWAHAPIKAALDLRAAHGLIPDQIEAIEIASFHAATRLAHDMPASTGKAQYSIDYPVACALAFGEIGAREVCGTTFADPTLTDLVARTSVFECDHCNANFPADRLGHVTVITKDGQRLDSGITRAPGEPVNPVDRAGVVEKFRAFTRPVLGDERSAAIERAVYGLADGEATLRGLTDLVYPPIS